MEKEFFEMVVMQKQKEELENVLLCNVSTEKYALKLTEQDAMQLLKSRISNLREQERVEFGEGILPKLIYIFCDSPYIYQDNYVLTLDALQEIFYEYKNETLDELTDDELLEFMKKHFDGDCQGSIEYLEETCLEKFARNIRYGYDE